MTNAALALSDGLRRFITEAGFAHNDRLPPERNLSGSFGVSRTELRRALAMLEDDGLIWRHVGRGTFIGARPVHNLGDVASSASSPSRRRCSMPGSPSSPSSPASRRSTP